jgi:hypothetical protein
MKNLLPFSEESCKKFLVAALLILISLNNFAQKNPSRKQSFGVMWHTGITGSGHGLFHTPSVFYKYNRSLFSVGTIMGSDHVKPHGLALDYQYSLTGDPQKNFRPRLELYAFGTFNYRPGCVLSRSAIEMEERDRVPQLAQLKINTYESYLGVGLKYRLVGRLEWINSIGFGAYYSPDAPIDIYRERSTACLILRTGLSLSFGARSGTSF